MKNNAKAAGKAVRLVGVAVLLGASAWSDELPVVESAGGANDEGGHTSFFEGKNWSNGLPPGPETNYVWSGFNLRTPDSNVAAYKDLLTVSFPPGGGGSESLTVRSAGNIAHKLYGADRVLVWPNLVWASSGVYAQSAANDSLARVQGRIQVEADMKLYASSESAASGHYDFSFENVFVGGAGRTLSIRQYNKPKADVSPGVVRVSGDNAAFLGRWLVQNFSESGRPLCTGMVLSLEHERALGGAPAAFDEAALTLEQEGAVSVAPWLAQPFAPDNKGLTVRGDATVGGRLATISNETWALGLPISGGGRLTKVGAGRVRLCGTNRASRVAVAAEGTLALATGFASPDEARLDISVCAGATVEVEPLTADGLALSNVSLPAGTVFRVPFDRATRRFGVVTLDASCALAEGPVSLALAGELATVAEEMRREVLAVPVSVRTLAADDLVEVDCAATAPAHTFEVEVQKGVQHVFAVLRPIVYTHPNAFGDGSQWWFTTAQSNKGVPLWSDEQACHGGVDYVCTNQVSFRTGSGQADAAVVFPGASLTMMRGNLALKHSSVFFTNLTVRGSTEVAASGSGSADRRQWIDGLLTVGGTREAPIRFSGQHGQNCCIRASMRGDGVARFAIYATATGENAVEVFTELTGDNSNFTGSMVVDEPWPKLARNERTNMVLRVGRAENLGGSPASFLYDALRLTPYAGLQPLASLTLATANRGIYLERGPCRFLVDEGCDLTVRETISFFGALRKEGAGTLALGGTSRVCQEGKAVTPNGSNNLLDVREGWIKPAGTNAFVDLKISFGAAGGLRLDADPDDPGVKDLGLFNAFSDTFVLEADALPVFVDLNRGGEKSFSVVLCTVRPAVAEALRGKLKVAKPRKGFALASLAEDAVTIGDQDYTRVTATFARLGATLILR